MMRKPATLAVFSGRQFEVIELTEEQQKHVGALLVSYCTDRQLTIIDSAKAWVIDLTVRK